MSSAVRRTVAESSAAIPSSMMRDVSSGIERLMSTPNTDAIEPATA